MIRTYSGAVCVITGGASGIGRAVAEDLVRRGADAVVLADLQSDLAAEAAKAIGPRAKSAALDVRDAAACERLFASVASEHGRVDYVFNNAGTGVFGEAHLLDADDWEFSIDVNLRGVVNVLRASYPRMIAQGYGHLINTASVAGLMAPPFLASYVATKHAVVGLSKSIRVEAARFGVRVSALCPGAIQTPLLSGGAFGRTAYDVTPERMGSWWKKMRPAPVGPFAKQVLDAVAKNEGVIVLPRESRVMTRLLRVMPWLEERMGKKVLEGTLRAFPEIARGKKAPAAAGAGTGATPPREKGAATA